MSLLNTFSVWSKVKFVLLTLHYFIHMVLGKNIEPTMPGIPVSDFSETRGHLISIGRKFNAAKEVAKERLSK